VGPALGGFVVAAAGPGATFALNAASFLAVLFVFARWRREAPEQRLPPEELFGAMRAGVRYVRHSPALRAVLARTGGFVLPASAVWALLPLYARDQLSLGPSGYGLLLAFFGAGALAYIVLARHFIRRLGERGMVLAGGAVMAVAFAAIGLNPPVWAFVVLLSACGMGLYLMHNTLQTNGTQMAPHARGLGMSLFATCLFVGQSIGITFAGWLVDNIGFEPAIIGFGMLLAVLGLFLSRRLGPAG
jgi:predicted MFS family arabinose efflux permease